MSPFCGATDTHVLFGLLMMSPLAFKPEWATLIMLGRGVHVIHFLRFTSGVAPADLLAANMAVELFSFTYLGAGTGGVQNWDLSCHQYLTVRDQADAELLSYAGSLSYVKFSTLEFNSFNLDVFDLWSRGRGDKGESLSCYVISKKRDVFKVMQAAILCVALVFFCY